PGHTSTRLGVGGPPADVANTSTPGNGVDDAVRRLEIGYDDAGRRFRFSSYAVVSGGSPINQVEQQFNGFGQLIKESQEHGGAVVSGTPAVQYGYSYDPAQASGPNHS